MYAVIKTGGKQYRVESNRIFRFEKLTGEVGSPVMFNEVLMFADGEDIKIGMPYLQDIEVKGHIVEHGRAKKVIIFKYKRRKRYRKKQGHRQEYTAVKVDFIGLPSSLSIEKTEKLENIENVNSEV